jgi:ribosome-binding factor A
MAHASAPSQRMLRAGELIRHALAEILLRGETNDPELDKLTASIVEVKISPDLKIATAFVRTLIEGQDQLLLEALNRNLIFGFESIHRSNMLSKLMLYCVNPLCGAILIRKTNRLDL